MKPLHVGWFVGALLFAWGCSCVLIGVRLTRDAHHEGWNEGWAARDAAYVEGMVRWNLQADSACVAWYPKALSKRED